MPDFLDTFNTAGTVGLPGFGHGSSLDWSDLQPFTQGYIEALFFTQDELCDCGFADLAPAALADIIRDCARFQADAAAPLALTYARGYAADQAGRDFWFTRNGHGVGFWDRGLGDLGDTLSDLARGWGEADAYLGDDGKVWL